MQNLDFYVEKVEVIDNFNASVNESDSECCLSDETNINILSWKGLLPIVMWWNDHSL